MKMNATPRSHGDPKCYMLPLSTLTFFLLFLIDGQELRTDTGHTMHRSSGFVLCCFLGEVCAKAPC